MANMTEAQATPTKEGIERVQRAYNGRIVPHLVYENIEAAVEWLTRNFNFIELKDYRKVGPDGMLYHAEMMTAEDGDRFLLGPPGGNIVETPRRTGRDTMALHVYVDDIDAHFARSVRMGVQVVAPCDHTRVLDKPEMQFYGDVVYWAVDLEGHYWTFNQRVHDLKPEDWKWDRALKPMARAPLPYLPAD